MSISLSASKELEAGNTRMKKLLAELTALLSRHDLPEAVAGRHGGQSQTGRSALYRGGPAIRKRKKEPTANRHPLACSLAV